MAGYLKGKYYWTIGGAHFSVPMIMGGRVLDSSSKLNMENFWEKYLKL